MKYSTLEERVAAYCTFKGYALPLHAPSTDKVPDAEYLHLMAEILPAKVNGVLVWHEASSGEVVKTYELNPEDNEGEKAVVFVETPLAVMQSSTVATHLETILDAELLEGCDALRVTRGARLDALSFSIPFAVAEKTMYGAIGRKVYISVMFYDKSVWTGVYEKTDGLMERLSKWATT